MREPREFKVVSCFDCGFVGNRVEVVKDVIPGGGWPMVEINHCVECGEACGAWITVREIAYGGESFEAPAPGSPGEPKASPSTTPAAASLLPEEKARGA